MVIGGLLVAGLVGWALTRTVEPAATVPPAEVSDAAPAATDVSTAPVTSAPMTTAQTETSAFPPLNPHIENEHAQTPEKAAVARMAVEDLRAKINRNAVTVIDVRDQASFERSHIPGALHLPLASIEANLSEIPKDKPVVTYCT
jgi:hypothetical protein